METKADVINAITGEKSFFVFCHRSEETHFFVDEAVQDGHQETLWRQNNVSEYC